MPPSKHIAILCNPLAGVGKAITLSNTITHALRQKQVAHELFTESWPDSLKNFTDAWIIGGDGTLHIFINHYPGIQLPLVIFNGGTGNDFHWLLYGSLSFEAQLGLALTAAPRPIDLCRCNDKLFINGLGIGFEGEVVRSLKGKRKRPGKTSFMATILRKIFSYRSRTYIITVDGKVLPRQAFLLVDASNGCRAGGGFHIAPTANASDGLFDLILVEALSPLRRLRWLPVIEKGKHLALPFVQHLMAKTLVVESDALMQAHIDGEYLEAERIEVVLLPAQVWFRY